MRRSYDDTPVGGSFGSDDASLNDQLKVTVLASRTRVAGACRGELGAIKRPRIVPWRRWPRAG
jgi:hypothetical protein